MSRKASAKFSPASLSIRDGQAKGRDQANQLEWKKKRAGSPAIPFSRPRAVVTEVLTGTVGRLPLQEPDVFTLLGVVSRI